MAARSSLVCMNVFTPTELNASIATTQYRVFDLYNVVGFSVQNNYADAAPAAKTFTDANTDRTADTITITAHGYITGTKVAATTSGALPTGLSATNYWVIKVDADTIKLASSLANAVAGTKVDMTAAGSGTHTLTPATASGNVFKLQKSNDQTNWTDISSMTVTLATSTVSTFYEVTDPTYRYLKAIYTPSAGQATISTYVTLVV